MRMTTFSDFVTGLMDHMHVDRTGLADRLGVSQPTVSRWFTQNSEPRQGTLRRIQELAREVGYAHDGIDNLPLVAVPLKSGTTTVEIRCYAGAGAEIFKIEGSIDVLDTVELPWLDNEQYEAVIVRGDSMHPVYRNNDILIFTAFAGDVRALLNRECVIELTDGRRYIKVLRSGSSPDRYNLDSYNGPTILDVTVQQALPITFVKRSSSAI